MSRSEFTGNPMVYALIVALSGLIWLSLGMAWVLCFEATTFGGWIPFVLLGLGPMFGALLAIAVVVVADRPKTD